MKIFVLASLLGALSLSTIAQTAANNETVTISGSKTQQTQRNWAAVHDQFARFTGSYELSNGNSLALFSRGMKNYAVVHGQARHEIVATSWNSFVAKDNQLQIKIERHENGEVSGELLMAMPADQVAGNAVANHLVKLALR